MLNLLILFIGLISGPSVDPDVHTMRNLFDQALQNREKTEALITYISLRKHTNLSSGYKGAATMLLAKHSSNPYYKYKYFISGKDMLESSIQTDSNQVELRYLRFIFQSNAPRFLNYKCSLEKDKDILIQAVVGKTVNDPAFLDKIITALMLSSACTESERKILSINR